MTIEPVTQVRKFGHVREMMLCCVVLCLSLLHMMAPASCWWEQRAKADNTTIPVVDFRDAADENYVCVPAVECGD